MRGGAMVAHGRTTASIGYRPDVQGLRALAVGVVILDHLFAWPAGGFVGVDVFFVISGFLITGLLLREHETTGRISFADFYRRRIRRIIPLAVLVLTTIYVASSWLFLGERVRSIGWDALSSALFAANWRFAASGTDYLQADGPISPLRHYWSLAVEEQFYVLWPILVVIILFTARRRFGLSAEVSRSILGVVLYAVVCASIVFAAWEVGHAPTVAYFSTFSRAWELGVGALIAVAAPWLGKVPAFVRPLLQWTGLACILVSVLAVDKQTDLPVPGAFLPVLSAALIIGGGIGGRSSLFPLTNPVARYIGDLSYSLYLWHFPVIILLAVVLPQRAVWTYAIALAVTALLSVTSYHFVENPVRRSAWLENRPKEPSRFRLLRNPVSQLVIGLATVVLITVVATPFDRPAANAPTSAKQTMGGITGEELAAQISTSLAAVEWPTLTPRPEDLGRHGFDPNDSQGCAPATPRGRDCTIRVANPGRLAVVVGDSTAVAWLPALRAALEPAGWTLHAMTYVGCPFIAATAAADDDSITRSCPGHKEIARSVIAKVKPALVIVSNAYNQRLKIGEEERRSLPDWEAAAETARRDWLAAGGRVVLLQAPPPGMDPKRCITRVTLPSDCVSRINDVWLTYAEADRRVWGTGSSRFIPTTAWFCDSLNRCPGFVDGVIIRRDATHITAEYARKLAPLVDQSLTRILAG